jgi:hypothetical protein
MSLFATLKDPRKSLQGGEGGRELCFSVRLIDIDDNSVESRQRKYGSIRGAYIQIEEPNESQRMTFWPAKKGKEGERPTEP